MALPPFSPEDVWADFNQPLNPLSGAKQPDKQQIRAIIRFLVDQLAALEGAAGVDPSILIGLRNDLNAEIARAMAAEAASAANLQSTASQIGLSDLKIGDTTTFGQTVIGNPADAGTYNQVGATGTTWIDAGSVTSDGSLVEVDLFIAALGSGQGSVVLVSSNGDGTYTYQAKIDVTIKAAGVVALRAGIELPSTVLRAGWQLGWYAPSGGAQIGFSSGGLHYAGGAPSVGGTFTPTGGTARFGISAVITGRPDRIAGYPANPGTATATGSLWISTDPGVAMVAGYLRRIGAYIQTAGNGQGVFAIMSPQGSAWRVEAIAPQTGLVAGLNLLDIGRAFPIIRLQAGWTLAYYAPAGGAQIAFNFSGSSGQVAGSGSPQLAQVVTPTPVSGATMNMYVSQIEAYLSLSERLAVLPGLQSTVAALPLADLSGPVYDRVTDCKLTVTDRTVTVAGTFSRGASRIPFSSSVTLDAPTSGSVTDEARTISQGGPTYAFAPAGNRLANANVSGVVVKDNGSGATLAAGTDYLVGAEHGVVVNAASGSRAVRVSYGWVRRRYDAVFLDPETLTLSVVRGLERVRDAQEFVPSTPAATGTRSPIRLCNARVASDVQIVPTWDVERGVRRSLAGQFARDQALAAAALTVTRGKAAGGQPISVAAVGDSIVAQQVTNSGFTRTPANGIYRDRSTGEYLSQPGALGPDAYSSLSLYDTGDGAGQVHTRLSVAWSIVGALQAFGSTVSYQNFCQGGTTSTDLLNDPTWFNGVINSDANTLLVHFGQNEIGQSDIESRIKTLLAAAYAKGMEAIVVTPPRTNRVGGFADSDWLTTTRALRRAAEWVDPASGKSAALVDASVLYDDAQLGALGIAGPDLCAANLYNHPGPFEIRSLGRLAVRIVTDALISVAIGAVTATKQSIGLGNVDNTSDAVKAAPGNPVGDAIAQALRPNAPGFNDAFSAAYAAWMASLPQIPDGSDDPPVGKGLPYKLGPGGPAVIAQ